MKWERHNLKPANQQANIRHYTKGELVTALVTGLGVTRAVTGACVAAPSTSLALLSMATPCPPVVTPSTTHLKSWLCWMEGLLHITVR